MISFYTDKPFYYRLMHTSNDTSLSFRFYTQFFFTILIALLIVSCSDSPSSPGQEPEPQPDPDPTPEETVGTLEISTITTGLDPDPRGYTISGENIENIDAGPNDIVTINELEEGTYSIELNDIESHCAIQSDNPVSVEIVAEETSEVDFEVNCKGIFREKIIFFRNQGGSAKSMNSMVNQSYYAMNYDGSEIETVENFSLNGRIQFASDISPDGTKMVVIYSETRNGRNSRIAIVEAYTNEFIFLNESVEGVSYFYPLFSPDGSKIAYIRTSDSSPKHDVFVMNSDGSNIVQVTNSAAREENIDWSPDGEKLIYHRSSNDYKYQGIFTINVDGTGEQLIIDSDLKFKLPEWSPNGDKIAVIGSQYDPYYYTEIYTMNSDGSNVQKVAGTMKESLYFSGLQWTPDGSKIYFLSNLDGTPHEEFGLAYTPMDIFIMNTDGTDIMNLTNTPNIDESNLMLTP